MVVAVVVHYIVIIARLSATVSCAVCHSHSQLSQFWYDYFDYTVYNGGKRHSISAPLDKVHQWVIGVQWSLQMIYILLFVCSLEVYFIKKKQFFLILVDSMIFLSFYVVMYSCVVRTFCTVWLFCTQVPVFIKGGSIVPTKWRARRSSAMMRDDPYTLIVALDREVCIVYI